MHMDENKMKFVPDHTTYTDDDQTKLIIEIALPGVKKENINFKINEDTFYLSAVRNDIEYVLSHSIYCPVKPDESKAKYDNGLLTVEVPFKDSMEGAVAVKVE